ncbi:MAG: GNAT family N-acetyltransferase [Proteobacteria bacterium]|nr:GNAT family N-acetyltransferase [Pseudomonadota bacterium]MBI3499155.1 GNAT family N-acetyltransferase [Pseudomonadota bacterium]
MRRGLMPTDRHRIYEIVRSTRFFTAAEERIAIELVDEALAKGEAESGYHFIFAERDGDVVGYACYGPIPGTQSSYDLYWIAVHARAQGARIGRTLHTAAEAAIQELGGTRVYADTSSKPQYEPTRSFYRRMGYREAARLEDFYAPGDGKVIFEKVLAKD